MRVWEYYCHEINIINKITINDTYDKQNILYKNRLIDAPLKFGAIGSSAPESVGGSASGWLDAVEKMGRWYSQNVNTYQGGIDNKHKRARKYYDCPLSNDKVADDCTAFVCACVRFFGIDMPDQATITMQPGTAWDRKMQANGFKLIPYDRSSLQAGDIMLTGGQGHASICGGNNKFWDWGNNRYGKLPCGFISANYAHVWRYTGSKGNSENKPS